LLLLRHCLAPTSQRPSPKQDREQAYWQRQLAVAAIATTMVLLAVLLLPLVSIPTPLAQRQTPRRP
jgi:hypothetical protein